VPDNSEMKKTLVIGANGQDGTFLVRHLLGRGHPVAGLDIHPSSRWQIGSDRFTYYPVDLREKRALSDLLPSLDPDWIFHLAAVHTSAGGIYEPLFNDVLQVNVASVHEILEFMRARPRGRLLYASSAKVFGTPLPEQIDDRTPRKNEDLYSISKNAAGSLIEYYRRQHKVQASSVFFFNHESELRPGDFFIPKILNCLAASIRDAQHRAGIHTLEFYCDWGSAEEYTGFLVDLIASAPGEDFLLAQGISTYARDLVERLFRDHGLDYRDHLVDAITPPLPIQPPYRVDLSTLQASLGRTPQSDIYTLCRKILDSLLKT